MNKKKVAMTSDECDEDFVNSVRRCISCEWVNTGTGKAPEIQQVMIVLEFKENEFNSVPIRMRDSITTLNERNEMDIEYEIEIIRLRWSNERGKYVVEYSVSQV